PAEREPVKASVTRIYPDRKRLAIANNAGQPFRFVHEMKQGGLGIYPSKRDRHVQFGRVEGHYGYNAKAHAGHPHPRAVKWLKSLPRSRFTQGALYEIGSAISLFLVKNYADEFRTALEGKAEPPPVSQDESVAAVAEDIDDTTRDFVLKRLAQE